MNNKNKKMIEAPKNNINKSGCVHRDHVNADDHTDAQQARAGAGGRQRRTSLTTRAHKSGKTHSGNGRKAHRHAPLCGC